MHPDVRTASKICTPLSLSFSLSLSPILFLILSLSLSLVRPRACALSRSLKHTHSLKNTFTRSLFTLSFSFSLLRFLSPSLSLCRFPSKYTFFFQLGPTLLEISGAGFFGGKFSYMGLHMGVPLCRMGGRARVLPGVHCVAVCRSVFQCVAVCCSVLQCGAVCCSVVQCVAVCCSVVQWVAVGCSGSQCVGSVLWCVVVCCGVWQCGAVYSALQ